MAGRGVAAQRGVRDRNANDESADAEAHFFRKIIKELFLQFLAMQKLEISKNLSQGEQNR